MCSPRLGAINLFLLRTAATSSGDLAAVRAFYASSTVALDCDLGLVQLQGSPDGALALRVSPDAERWPGGERYELTLSRADGNVAWEVRDALHAEATGAGGGGSLVHVTLAALRPPDGTFTVHLRPHAKGAADPAAAPTGAHGGQACGEAW